jgi:hypothetical protein
VSLGQYVIQVGKRYSGRKICDVSLNDLGSYCKWLEDSSAKDGKPLSDKASELVAKLKEYEAALGCSWEQPSWQTKKGDQVTLEQKPAQSPIDGGVPW